MGILNVTPDSFYDGGRYTATEALQKQALQLLSDGADIIDIGGYSSRPGADDISVDEEMERTCRAVESVLQVVPEAILSVDTFRSAVAREAVKLGASMVNDISGGTLDEEMFATVAALKVPYILMHMRGTPQTMTQHTDYDNLAHEVLDFFADRLKTLRELGVHDVILDPGFGFAKTVEQNFELLRRMEELHLLQRPLLIGLSRKSMIWRTLAIEPQYALNGTTVLNTIALQKGAAILRVHDVAPAREAITLLKQLQA